MKTWLLVVMFITATGDKIQLDGWGAVSQPSKEICEVRLEFLKNYMDNHQELPQGITGYEASCQELEW